MNLFDILGPVMVGPSSSHTAGAVRIGYISRKLLKDTPVRADICLHGSFATTGVGHGTDKALIAGLLGMQPDDMRIPQSFEIAEKAGLIFSLTNKTLKDAHPNTAVIKLVGREGKRVKVQAASIGGGRIQIDRLNGMEVHFSAQKPTLIVHNVDRPGYAAEVTSMLAKKSLNVATMHLYRDKRGGDAVMVIETDGDIGTDVIMRLEQLDGVHKVSYIE